MFEAYKIGVSLTLQDGISGALATICAGVDAAAGRLDRLERSLRAVTRAQNALNRSMAAAARAPSSSSPSQRQSAPHAPMPPMLLRAPTGGHGAVTLLPASSGGGGGVPTLPRGALGAYYGGAGGAGGAAPRYMGWAEVVPPGGGGGGGGRRGGGRHDYESHFGAAIAAGAGWKGVSALGAPLDEAKQFQLEAAKFEALGLGEKMNRDAIEFARGMKTYGTSLTENLVLFRDAQTVFRDSGTLEHAKLVTPLLAKMRFANETLYGADSAAQVEGKFMDMLRVIELRRGLNSPGEFAKQANMIQQVLATSGGRVDASQYLNLIKTGGVAAKHLSNESLYYQLEPVIQEMGGSRVGTGLMSAYSNLILGRTTKQVVKELAGLGLLDESHVEYNKLGQVNRVTPGGLKGAELMQSSPFDYLEKVLLPAFEKKGITGEEATLRELGLIFSNRTASQLFSTMYLQRQQIRNGEEMSRKAMNIDQAEEKARNTASGADVNLHKQWANSLNALGTTVLPLAIKGVQLLTRVLEKAAGFATGFPGVTKVLLLTFGAASLLVGLSGSILLAAFGFRAVRSALALLQLGRIAGLFRLAGGAAMFAGRALGGVLFGGLRLIGGAVMFLGRALMLNPVGLVLTAIAGAAYLLWSNWDTVGPKLAAAWDSIKAGAGSLADWVRQKWEWLRSFLPGGGPAIAGQTIAPRSSAPVQVATQVNLDGRTVAEVVTQHQAKEANRPVSRASGFDPGMGLSPVSMGYRP